MICPPLAPALVVSLFFSSLLLLQDMPPASAQQQAPVYPPVPLLPPPYGAPRTGTLLVIDGQVVINTTRPLPPFTVYTSGTGRKNIRSEVGTWEQAPTCPPGATTGLTRDKQGRQWGWDKLGQFSCAVRPPRPALAPLLPPPQVGSGPVQASPSPPQVAWQTAPVCPMDITTEIVLDTELNPWGWDPGKQRSCAGRYTLAGTPMPAAPSRLPSELGSQPSGRRLLRGHVHG